MAVLVLLLCFAIVHARGSCMTGLCMGVLGWAQLCNNNTIEKLKASGLFTLP